MFNPVSVRMTFERLVTNPEAVMRSMCERLGIPYHADLVQPYKNIDKKMTDGIYDESMPMGDTKLLEHKHIDATVADTWRDVVDDDFLGEPTWDMAVALGYERPN